MLQDIFPKSLDLTFKRQAPADDDVLIALKDNQALLLDAAGGPRPLRFGEFRQMLPEAAGDAVYLFSVSGTAFHYYNAAKCETTGFCPKDVFFFYTHEPGWEAFGAAAACHLGSWYGANAFCGACGSRRERAENERALRCPSCGSVVYPRISPVVIVGVVNGDRILLTRDARRPNSRLTGLVAGFAEIGETLEDAVRREVMEEVGLRVKNIRYYKSQPWPFTESLLTGFYADLNGPPETTLDESELLEARWLARDEISPDENLRSLTATMIEAFRTGNEQ